ncbi:MAG TPA: OmpA family protein, partial [Campylobacterales bacterium]|nr:OmpA family protein [Campylobacterales bacterium]
MIKFNYCLVEYIIMKIKVLFIILVFNFLDARTIENELGINMGMTSINNEKSSRFNNYGMGINYQLDKYIVMPRFDLDYVKISDFSDNRVDSLFKGSINGVYEFENRTNVNPYIMGGFGYEKVSGEIDNTFESHPFVQGGMGLRYKLKKGYKAQVEGKMLQIIGGNDENNELILNFGMSFPIRYIVLHKKRKKIVPGTKVIIKQPIIINRRVVTPTPTPQPVIQKSFDNQECPIKISLPDRDRDGIEDRFDQCPNTPCDFLVDGYGCPVKMTLRINFVVNSAVIDNSYMPRIDNFARFLLRNRGSRVVIEGHTDSSGDSTHNLILSENRARAVASRLFQLGVSPSRITVIGKGETMPIASNSTKDGKRLN